MKTDYKPTLLGLILLCFFFLQCYLKFEWGWLADLQKGEMYKRWSGLGLALLITFQWVLTLTRVINKLKKHSMKMNAIHKWLGAISPIIFYIHSISLGYGYLLFLSYMFFTNAALGYINLDVIKVNNNILFKGWMITHVALSIIITITMLFHISMVFYYK